VISKWHILVNFEVLNVKLFFIVRSLSGVRVDSVANFGFSSIAIIKQEAQLPQRNSASATHMEGGG